MQLLLDIYFYYTLRGNPKTLAIWLSNMYLKSEIKVHNV
jgi:hypothetical protein